MDAPNGWPRAEDIHSVAELKVLTLDARKLLLEEDAERHAPANASAITFLQKHAGRVPMLRGATDFAPHRPEWPYDPDVNDGIDMANAILAWCDRQGPTSPKTRPDLDAEATNRLLSLYTGGLADDRLREAASILRSNLNTNEKLEKMDGVIPIPSKASAEQLGRALDVKRQAVMKTAWWSQNRKGEKANEIGRRRDVHKERAKQSNPTWNDNADDDGD